ncbi:hypothetical protein BGX23_001412, partial [Mortierella sp. AD031]
MGSQAETPSVHSDNATVVIESEKSHSNIEQPSSTLSPNTITNNNNAINKGEKQEYTTITGAEKEEIIDDHHELGSSKQKIEEGEGVVAASSASSSKGSLPSAHGNLNPGPDNPAHHEVVSLPFKQLMVVFVGLMLGIFLASLDQTIVSVCTTKIASEFNGLNQIPWIGTSYLLTSTTFQPL